MKQVQELQDPELIHRRLKSTLKALLIVVCAGIAYIAVFRMTGTGVPCLFRTMTGSLCPFCGMTHALGELSKGHFASAMSYNALSLTLFPVLLIYIGYREYRYVKTGETRITKPELVFLILCALICIFYFLLRNHLI